MGSQEASEPLSGVGEEASPEAGGVEADVLIEESSSPQVTEGVDRTNERRKEYVVSLPERGISLYQVDEGGVFLAIGEREQQMNWIYTTPRLVMPRLQADDYDRDGEDELAVALNTGSGTGVNVEELHIVELPAETAPDDEPFVDRVFLPEHYMEQLRSAVTFETKIVDGEWVAYMTMEGDTYEVQLGELMEEFGEMMEDFKDKPILDEFGFGNIVYFEFGKSNADIKFTAAVGVLIEDVSEPQYFGDITAAVRYSNGEFR